MYKLEKSLGEEKFMSSQENIQSHFKKRTNLKEKRTKEQNSSCQEKCYLLTRENNKIT